MNEIDSLLEVDSAGIITYEGDAAAKYARLQEWFNTPEGSVYGMPGWGNPIVSYKHEPTGWDYLALHLEGKLIEKLRIDLPEVGVMSIYCYPANGLPEYGGKGGFVIEIQTEDFKFTHIGG